MVELIVWKEGTDSQNLSECLLARGTLDPGQWDFYRSSWKRGDLMKVMPKRWHRYFKIPADRRVVRVRRLDFISAEKRLLTEPLKTASGEVVQRRRYALRLEGLKDIPVVTVRSLDKLLIDKEDM